jgi:HAD superfamily hydrolase (TIGR01509 family)
MVEELFDKINLEGVKGILIDLDNTLYPYDINHERAMDKCIEECQQSLGISKDQFKDIFKLSRDAVHHSLNRQAASHSRLLYFQKFSEIYFGFTKPDFALDMEELYWSEFMSGMSFMPGVERFLKKVKEAGIKSCVVTDLTTQIQLRKWQKLDLGKYIDFMVTSEEAGIEKPDRIIFDMALAKLGLDARQTIMIGDNKEKDIKGAELMGIKSYLIG